VHIVLLLALLVLELILQQQALTRAEEAGAYEPLLPSPAGDEEASAGAGAEARRPGKDSLGRWSIALQSFRYVWPTTGERCAAQGG
jgi:hypothetical protein